MKWFIALAGLVTALLMPGHALADFPHLMNFQGRLDDSTGKPLPDANYNVTFRLFNDPASGAALWTETQSVTTVDGVFSVLLGAIDTIPQFVFYQDSTFLEIQPAGSDPVAPRWQLSVVPFAWRAFNADMVDGQSATDLEESAEVTAAITAHAAIPNAHHEKTINASELILGTLSEGRLPQGAIDSTEIEVESIASNRLTDEPGLAHTYTGFMQLSTTLTIIDSISITVPRAGWMLVMANGWFIRNHVNGIGDCSATVSISPIPGSHIDTYSAKFSVISSLPTGAYHEDFMVSQVLPIGVGTTKLYLLGDSNVTVAVPRVEQVHLNAIFFSTAYGNIDNLAK